MAQPGASIVADGGKDGGRSPADSPPIEDSAASPYRALFRVLAVPLLEVDLSAIRELVPSLSQLTAAELGQHMALHPALVREMLVRTQIVDCNDQGMALLGCAQPNELLGELCRFWSKDDFHVFADILIAGRGGENSYQAETRLRTRDGRHFEAQVTAYFSQPLQFPGRLFVQVVAPPPLLRPRTSLEESERRYRNLFQFVPFPLFQLDRTELADTFEAMSASGVRDFGRYCEDHPDFVEFALNSIKIKEVNRRALDLFGAYSPAQLLGPVKRIWTENPEVFQRSMEARYNGATRYEAEIKIRTFDGRVLDVLYVTDFPEALQNEPLGVACMVDISDRLKAEETLRQVQAEFAHAGRVSMLGELTTSIAHEINQPLGAILTGAEAGMRWLNRAEPDLGELRALAERIAIDARRAAAIIRRVRDLAAPSEPERQPTSINSAVEDVAVFLEHEAKRHQVDIELDLAPDLPSLVLDRVQIQQVLANLVVNAMQAMASPDRVQRRVTLRTRGATASGAEVEVEDTGPGIPEALMESIFSRFFTTKNSGMGIGLAVCRSIAEGHGGEIRVANSPKSGGAIFTVTLPVETAAPTITPQ